MNRFTYKAANVLYEVEAYEYDGYSVNFYRERLLHRENGPACIYSRHIYYYLDGNAVSKEEHAAKTRTST